MVEGPASEVGEDDTVDILEPAAGNLDGELAMIEPADEGTACPGTGVGSVANSATATDAITYLTAENLRRVDRKGEIRNSLLPAEIHTAPPAAFCACPPMVLRPQANEVAGRFDLFK